MASLLQGIIQGMGGTDSFSSPGAATPISMNMSGGSAPQAQQTTPQTSLSGTIMNGGSAPLTGNVTPTGNTTLTSNITPTNTGITNSSPLASLATPGTTNAGNSGLYNINPYDMSKINDPNYTVPDPFNMAAEGLGANNGYNESNSPGFQQYGQTYLNLINSTGQLPSNFTQAPSSNYTVPEDQLEAGGGAVVQQAGQYANSPFSDPNTDHSIVNLANNLNNQANPLGIVTGGQTTGLANKVLNDYSSNNDFGAASAEALPGIEKTFGLTGAPAQQYADAYTTDVLQNQKYDQYHNFLTDTKHDLGDSIITGLGKAFGNTVAFAGPGFVFGPAAAAEGAADTAATAGESAGSSFGSLGDAFSGVFPTLDSLSTAPGLFTAGTKLAGGLLPGSPAPQTPMTQSSFGTQPLTLASAILGGQYMSPSFNGNAGNVANTDYNPYAKNVGNSWTN